MIPEVGTPAPEFELTWKIGEPPVRRSTYQEGYPLVILFFPLAFSSVCREELCTLAADWSSWSELGARVLGISVDSPFVNVRFADDTRVPFPLLSDFNKEVAEAYGVLNRDFFGMDGVADRSAFVVDRDGILAYAWTTSDASVLPDFDAIRETVESLLG